MNTPAINSVLAKHYKSPANATHRYTPQLVFIMNVRIDNNEFNRRIWGAGPDPDPAPTAQMTQILPAATV